VPVRLRLLGQGGEPALEGTLHIPKTGQGELRVAPGSYRVRYRLESSCEVLLGSPIALTGNLTLTTSNLASGRAKFIRLTADASTRTLTFPAGWTFLNSTAPGTLAAGKTALLFLIAFGTTDSTVVASYAVQP
jgi:hypothetical protein